MHDVMHWRLGIPSKIYPTHHIASTEMTKQGILAHYSILMASGPHFIDYENNIYQVQITEFKIRSIAILP